MKGIPSHFSINPRELGATIIISIASCLFHLILNLYYILTAVLITDVITIYSFVIILQNRKYFWLRFRSVFSAKWCTDPKHSILEKTKCFKSLLLCFVFCQFLGILFCGVALVLGGFSLYTHAMHNWTMSFGVDWGNRLIASRSLYSAMESRFLNLDKVKFMRFQNCRFSKLNQFVYFFQAKTTMICVCDLMKTKHDLYVVSF